MVDNAEIYTPVRVHKVGPPRKFITDPDVALDLANKTNTLIDQNFGKELKGTGKRSRFAQRQTTKLAIEEAVDKVAFEKRLTTDEMTGLGSYYKFRWEIESVLKEHLPNGFSESDKIVDKEALSKYHILRLDIGMLSYANTLPRLHDNGNRYKIDIANIVGGKTPVIQDFMRTHNIKMEGFATTVGDEFGIVAKCDSKTISELMQLIQDETGKLSIGEGSKVPASVSVGEVNVGEYFDNFLEFYSKSELPSEAFYKSYFHFLNSVADFKSVINKVHDRVPLLINLRTKYNQKEFENEEYQALRRHAVRGALEISDEKLDSFVASDNFELLLKEHIATILNKRIDAGLASVMRPLDRITFMTEKNILAEQ